MSDFATTAEELRRRAHVLRTRALRTSVRECRALRERAARLDRTARILDTEAAVPPSEYDLPDC